MNHPCDAPVLNWKTTLFWCGAAIGSFHLAYSSAVFSFAILFFLFCLFQLRRLGSTRKAFYTGLVVGLAIYAPHLKFFLTLFGFAAVVLWSVLAFWIAIFLLAANHCTRRFGSLVALSLIPFLWTGIEFFRSELYYLRFSWLNIGFVFEGNIPTALNFAGVYGIGFIMAAIAAIAVHLRGMRQIAFIGAFCLPLLLAGTPTQMETGSGKHGSLEIAGVQLEFPSERDVLSALNKTIEQHPAAKLLVLSEYTFSEQLPERVNQWCKDNDRYLVVGAHDPVGETNYYNTAFVIDPKGDIVFRQAKSVPIQFFKDGLPAREQKLWDSPWGKIGIAICYDLSYRRVIDNLVKQGAQALIIPTMDVIDWGEYQHRLHARVAPTRAAEYGVPIFRVCSSGISQFVDSQGRVIASAPFPGEGDMLMTALNLGEPGRVPIDRWLAPFCVVVTVALICWLLISQFLTRTQFK